MKSFDLVAMGGTFDIIHSGHMALLNKAFSISIKVITVSYTHLTLPTILLV